jgi:HD-GYP domain-containing protein (c-di-GMP phosphodiesterase class II)
MEPYEVGDQNHWFTQEQINRFHQKLSQLTGAANIAREAGRYAASTEAIGVMRQYVLGMISPPRAYGMLGKYASHFTRSITVKTKLINSRSIEVVVTPNEGVHEQPFQCENRIGHFESINFAFYNTMPKIDHPECIFKGDRRCRYIIEWENNRSYMLKRTKNIIAAVMLIISVILTAVYPIDGFIYLIPMIIATILVLSFLSEKETKKQLTDSIHNLEHSRDDLIGQMEANYNNSQMVQEIGNTINRHGNLDEILNNVIQILENRLGYDRCLIMLANEEKTKLVFKAGFGYNEKQLSIIKTARFDLTKPQSKGVFVTSFKEQKSYLINDISTITDKLSQKSLHFAKSMGSESFICCAIKSDKNSLGILAVDNFKTKRTLIASDLNLLAGIASVLGVSIRNAQLHEERISQLKSILKALAASIDARDPFTAGHSEKVTEYAVGICQEMNIPADYTEIVAMAASLHDYGKIGISDDLLKKEGALTEREYEVIKTHSVKTRNILEQINFHGSYSMIPMIAEAHHEKLDGSGYPRGLKGEEIPLGSRIIAVADFFEAITAKRIYRDPMPAPEAIEMLRRESDVHFSREIVEAFINYYTIKTG